MPESGDRQDDLIKEVLTVLQSEAPSIEAELKEGFCRTVRRTEERLAAAGIRLPEERLRQIGKALLGLLLFEKEDLQLCGDVLRLKGFLAQHRETRFNPFDRLHAAYARCLCRGKAPDPSDPEDGDFRLLCALALLGQSPGLGGGAEADLNLGAAASLSSQAELPVEKAERSSAAESADASAETEETAEAWEETAKAADASAEAEKAAEAPERPEEEEGGAVFSWSPLPEEEFFREHTPAQALFFGRPLVWEKTAVAEAESGTGWDEVLVLLLRLLTDKSRCSRYCTEQGISLPKLFCDDADFRSRRFRGLVRQDRLDSLIKSEHNFQRPEYICAEAVLEKAAPHREKWELLLKILRFLQVENEEIVIKYVKIHADNRL